MRGADITQPELFSYRTLEERIPKDHPLRKLRTVVDQLLATLDLGNLMPFMPEPAGHRFRRSGC